MTVTFCLSQNNFCRRGRFCLVHRTDTRTQTIRKHYLPAYAGGNKVRRGKVYTLNVHTNEQTLKLDLPFTEIRKEARRQF